MNAQTSKKGTFIIPLIIGVLIAGALAWYFWPQLQQKSAEVPPSITISSSKFQGLISGGDVCKIPGIYAFTDAQVSNYIKPGADADANWSTLEQGVHIYHSGESLMVQEIINAIVPTTGNKIMIAYYPADKGNVEKKFVTYPGIAGQEAIEKPEAYTIPEDQGFVIFSCQDTKIWKIRTEKKGAGGVTSVLGTKEAGWILMPAVVNEGIVEDGFLAVHKNKIKSAWFQKGPGFDFQKVEDMNNAKLIGDWKMIWLKIGPVEQQADPAAIPQTINITKQEGLNKQVVIEWTDSAPNNVSGYLIIKSTQKNIPCLNECSYVDDFDIGNWAGGIDVKAVKKFTDKLLLDDATYYYIIKSFDSDTLKIIGTSVEFSVKTLSAAEIAGMVDDMNEVMEATEVAAAAIKANMDAAAKSFSDAFGNWGNAAADAIPETITVSVSVYQEVKGEKEVFMIWSDNAPQNVHKYLIYRSETSPVNMSKLNYVDNTFDPGNLVGIIMSNAAMAFNDKKLLKNNTKYYYIIKSRDSQNKVIGTSKEFSVTTALPPLQ